MERGRPYQAGVGRDRIALLDQDDIARHQLRRGHTPSLAVAQHGRLVRGHRPQSGNRPLGPSLLNVAQNTVEQHDREDGQPLVRQRRVTLVDPQPERDRRGHQQQDDQDVLKLRQETPPGRYGLSVSSSFGPYCRRRALASWPLSPCRGSLLSSATTSSAVIRYASVWSDFTVIAT